MFGKLKRGHDDQSRQQNTKNQNRLSDATIKNQSKDLEKQLLKLPLPLDSTDASQLFLQVSRSPRQKQILAVATGHDASNWQTVNESDLTHLLDKPAKGQPDYRTPVGFAKFRQEFIDGIRAQATPDQLASYHESMDALERTLYGERFAEYQRLANAGTNANTIKNTDTTDTAKPAEIESPNLQTPKTPEDLELTAIISEETSVLSQKPTAQDSQKRPQQPSIAPLSPITPERSNELLGRTIISGDPWRQDGADYRLNPSSLTNSSLVPTCETTLDGLSIAFSTPFQLSDGRGAILGYVEASDGIHLRSYYLNPKTGLWYFAPDIIRGPRGDGMSQVTDGYGPASTTLPVLLQQHLTTLIKATGFHEITTLNPDFLFAGTTAEYDTLQDYRTAFNQGQMRSDFYREVDQSPALSNWQPAAKSKNAPQLISVNSDLSPDFSTPVARFASYSTLAGQITLEAFPSHDQQFIWIFASDEWGRVWLANLEAVSPITSTGCRRNWTNPGDLATPLYENTTKSFNFGDPSDTRKGLIGMWNQYLSKIPLIESYISARSRLSN